MNLKHLLVNFLYLVRINSYKFRNPRFFEFRLNNENTPTNQDENLKTLLESVLDTKLSEFKKEIKNELSEFKKENKNELSEFKKEIKNELSEFKKEIKNEISEFKGEFEEIKNELSEFEKEIKNEFYEFKE